MTFMEKLEKEAKIQTIKPLSELPNEIKLKWVSEQFKNDQTNRECFFVTYITEDGQTVKQKYTATMYARLHEAIIQIGSVDKLKADYYLYRKEEIGKRGSYPRLYPVLQESRRKKQD